MNLEDLKEKFNIVLMSENSLRVEESSLHELFVYLKNNSLYSVDMLLMMYARDVVEFFEITYFVYSSELDECIAIMVKVDKQNPIINSIADIFDSANWDEREIYDLYGIKFLNHPNLKRLFLPECWKGHPLRKDYVPAEVKLI